MRSARTLKGVVITTLSATLALGLTQGQTIPKLRPFTNTLDVLVCDSTNDKVWRMMDLNQDGDFNDPEEVIEFYDPVFGGFSLGSPEDVGIAKDGKVFVCDSGTDVVLWMQDGNGNGRADDPGECGIFFDSATNGSGITMSAAQSLTVDDDGIVWVAVTNAGNLGTDHILRLEDLNADGDANDSGEALKYLDIISSALGDSIPTEVRVGADGNIYYLENGVTGVYPRGVFRLHDDVVVNGNCNDPGESSQFHTTPPQAGNSFLWAMQVDRSGVCWYSDYNHGIIFRVEDLNGDDVIQAGTAEEVYFLGPTGRTITWGMDVRDDGAILTAIGSPFVLNLYHDLDQSGRIDQANETITVYDPAFASVAIGNPKSCSFMRDATLLTTPNPVQGGNQLTIMSYYNPWNVGTIFTSPSTLTMPFALPPLGEIDLNPTFMFPLGTFALDGTGRGALPLNIPSGPGLTGTVFLQGAYLDPFRARLSNVQALTIQ